ncbi:MULTISPECIES: hypothetical protein [Pseudomonadaceae]|nr:MULTISPECIES: hypothetical protein [Pseudomonas]
MTSQVEVPFLELPKAKNAGEFFSLLLSSYWLKMSEVRILELFNELW